MSKHKLSNWDSKTLWLKRCAENNSNNKHFLDVVARIIKKHKVNFINHECVVRQDTLEPDTCVKLLFRTEEECINCIDQFYGIYRIWGEIHIDPMTLDHRSNYAIIGILK